MNDDLTCALASSSPGVLQVLERFRIFDRILSSLPAEPDGPALVYEVPGENRVEFIVLPRDEVRVGRRPLDDEHPDFCHLAFPSQRKLSSRHFRIFHDGEDFILEDLESKNGTYCNQEERRVRKRILTSGDLILAGDLVFAFQGEIPPAPLQD